MLFKTGAEVEPYDRAPSAFFIASFRSIGDLIEPSHGIIWRLQLVTNYSRSSMAFDFTSLSFSSKQSSMFLQRH
ncbi:hypothetical protein Csa_014510 [Cucumis sativus]|uniref:Uncharacterized protein n=1 Tax=Cucumis sativus TaxID=3659 RepID=A0A0A0KUW1_CUCSA|nr:hypothetical protein Csa_014510 [Cucumis sativus]